MTAVEARDSDEVIFGTFLINSLPASVLFDSGASCSFVSTTFYAQFVNPRCALDKILVVEVATGEHTTICEKYSDCLIKIDERTFPLTLLPIGIMGFDVVIGMDWMSANGAEIVCSEKTIRIPLNEGGYVITQGEKSREGACISSIMKARKCMSKGCLERMPELPIIRDRF